MLLTRTDICVNRCGHSAVYVMIMSLVIISFALFSCDKPTEPGPNTGELAGIFFRLNIVNQDIIETKAIDESSVANLWVLQFNGSSDASVLIKSTYYSSPDISNLKLYLYNGTSQSVYFIANTFDGNMFNAANAPLNSYTILMLKNKTITYSSQDDNFVLYSGNQYTRMTGLYSGNIPGGATLTASLYRVPAKIVLTYTSIAAWDNAIVKINSVALKNVPSTSRLLSNPSNSTVYEPTTVFNYSAITSGVGPTSGSVTLYMPENIRGVVSNSLATQKAALAPVKSTYIEVNGSYYYPQSASTPSKTVLYRIYLGVNEINDYNVNSNSRYSVTATFKGINLEDSRVTAY